MSLRVVMATRGKSEFLAEAVASVSRGAPGAELVVVCPAEKMEAMAQAVEKLGRARLIAETGRGLYAALNQGFRAGGEWEMGTWLNDDDVLHLLGFAEMIRRAGNGMTFGRVELIDGRGGRLGEIPVARRGGDVSALLTNGIMPLAQPGTVLSREVWELCGGFDESYRLAGDLDFFVRALARGVTFEFVNETVAAFRLRAGQLSKRSAEMAEETVRARRGLVGVPASTVARWRFRVGNLGVYFERVRRHGWVSMQQLTERTK